MSVVVIGGGAAGIIAAWRAAALGVPVTLLEKTPRLGTKILISGGGKCNITHDGPLEDLVRAFRPNEARFIRPSCYRFTNRHIIELLESQGLEVYTRPDGRIFPTHGTAKEVVAILEKILGATPIPVDIRLNCPAIGLVDRKNRIVAVSTHMGELLCDSAIISVGGSSYPNSGTTGDGWQWLSKLGHTIVPITPALAPIDLMESTPWPGVSIRDCILKARCQGKEIARWAGDLLFTHHGVSGPCALGISREVAEHLPNQSISLEVDICPHESFEALTAKVHDWALRQPKKPATSLLDSFLPSRLSEALAASVDISPLTPGSQLSAKMKNRLVAALKGWSLGEVRQVPLSKGEVVAGGLSLDEVDPHTMRSNLIANLYLCGEVLDVAGPVGGYNLQAAFSTGYVAGESAASSG